jgi:N-acetyl-1-D-myo-inositol-2-amino-2-deoxy-alpha-D-glucopyranoside deacetylase/mycothiol S-conjugate amidase
MNHPRTLIFVGAHPDDETFGMGATLAKYAAAGVKVYYICCTGGEAGTVEPQYMQGYHSIAELRRTELTKAAEVLQLSGVFYLGYRDSGMAGSADNQNPQAFINAPSDEVAGRIVKIFRELQPEVVVTHDPSGGYNHPDHIMAHKATVTAFKACGDINKYPETGPVFQPARLYYGVRSHRMLKLVIRIMRLFGRNVHKFGRNKDIDLTRMVQFEYPIHAYVKLSKKDMAIRQKAAACHASQGGGMPLSRGGGVMGFVNGLFMLSNRLFGYKDFFMRAYPEPKGKRRESDLFQGI